MNSLCRKYLRFLLLLVGTLFMAELKGAAQTPASLGLQLYSGLSITGNVGSIYAISYVTNLTQTNAWRCLEFLQLPTSPSFVDGHGAGAFHPQRPSRFSIL